MLIFSSSVTSDAQQITWNFPETEKVVTSGVTAGFEGHFNYSENTNYSLKIIVDNISLPNGWHFQICNPFQCLAIGAAQSTFSFPNSSFLFLNNGVGSESCVLHVKTTLGNTIQVGELDLKLINTVTEDTLSQHITVTTNGTSLDILENEREFENFRVYPNPILNEIKIPNDESISFVTISDCLGRVIINNKIENDASIIDFSRCSSGVYTLVFFNINSEVLSIQKIQKQ